MLAKFSVVICVAIVALISGQLLAQDTDTTTLTPTSSTKLPKDVEEQQSKEFYGKLNHTLLREFHMFPKRVECMIGKLEKKEAHKQLKQTNFFFLLTEGNADSYESREQEIRIELNEAIKAAEDSCTIIGYSAIVLIAIVMTLIVAGVTCLNRKK